MSDTKSRVLMAMTVGKTYEMAELARRHQLPIALMRETVEQLIDAGYVVRRLAGAQYGERAGYRRYGLTTAGCRAVETLNPTANVSPSIRSRVLDAQRLAATRPSDVLAVMQPGESYRIKPLAQALGLPAHRVVTFLQILIRRSEVVSVNRREPCGNIIPCYYLAGTQPGARPAEQPRMQIVASGWTNQPAFDAEYGRTLNTLRALSQVSRGKVSGGHHPLDRPLLDSVVSSQTPNVPPISRKETSSNEQG